LQSQREPTAKNLLYRVDSARKILLAAVAISLFAGASQTCAAQKLKDRDCLSCHSDPTLTREVNGKPVSIAVDQDSLTHSVHGSLFSCVDCHTDVKSLIHESTPQKVLCAQCHLDAQIAYSHSQHAKTTAAGGVAANCQDCHGGAHQILAADDAKSPVNHANIPETCGRCHGQKFLMESNGESAQAFLSYQQSVHGLAIEKGSKKAAVCTDCHGTHEILRANDQKSPIYKFNVPATCGKCHTAVQETFMQSIHGQGIARGNGLAPVCTDCHGIHSIKAHIDPNSSVSEQNIARTTCAQCHEGVRLSQEFGVAGNRVSSYMDSYHGLAAEGGSAVVANCASCHGVHNILPSSDPHSTINRANLDTTCGKCHQGVTQKFTLTPVHMADGAHTKNIGSLAVNWVRWIYLTLIFTVIGAMFLHNAILWRSKAAARRALQNPFMVRMTANQRWQHLILLTSFIVLVITGFALKFPNSWIAAMLGNGNGERLRGIIHRIAGVVLIGAGIYHIFYLAIAAEGRRLVRDLAPGPSDAFDVFKAMRYSLGLGGEKPKFSRFSYAEKAEYWAMVWGTALMALTGIMMWAKVTTGNLLARWWVDVATSIHFYEAILATLAIFVWHFYQVFLDPDIYPMNWAWWDGKMPVEQYRHEHELDTDALPPTDANPTEEGELPVENS
jgi:cytochrome b subunit of formate dehydrogenase